MTAYVAPETGWEVSPWVWEQRKCRSAGRFVQRGFGREYRKVGIWFFFSCFFVLKRRDKVIFVKLAINAAKVIRSWEKTKQRECLIVLDISTEKVEFALLPREMLLSLRVSRF